MKKVELTPSEKKLVKRIKEYSSKEFTSDFENWMHWDSLSEDEQDTAYELSYKGIIRLFPNRECIIELK